MEEEKKIQDAEIVSMNPTPEQNAESQTPEASPAPETVKSPEKDSVSGKEAPEKPQVIVKKERGFTYFVGFALLTVLAIIFFFIPGIALVYLVSCLAAISAPVAWIFAAILSVIVWFIFKLKIKGFKKSFLWYIGLCVLISIILISLSALTSYQVLSGILSLLIGGAN